MVQKSWVSNKSAFTIPSLERERERLPELGRRGSWRAGSLERSKPSVEGLSKPKATLQG